MIRPGTLVALTICLLIGCGSSDGVPDPTVEYQLAPTRVRADTLRIERQGSGQIDFVVRRAAMSGVFDVHVTTAEFRTLNVDFSVVAGNWVPTPWRRCSGCSTAPPTLAVSCA